MNLIIFQYLNNLSGRSDFFDFLIVFFAEYLPYLLIAGLFVPILLLLWQNRKIEDPQKIIKSKIFYFSGFLIFSVILARLVFTELIRYFYHSPRPFINNDVNQLVFHDLSGSFPSGHAAFFFALAMAVYFFHKRWSVIFFISAFFISISRVIAGIHWPADILAGAIVGIFSAYVIFAVFKKYLKGP